MGNNNCQECTNKEVHVINELLLDNKFFKDSIELNNPNTNESSKVNSLKVSREDLKKALENTNLPKDYKDYIRKIVDDNELKESGTIEPSQLRLAKNNDIIYENNVNEIEDILEQKKIIEEQREQILEQQKIIEEFKKKQKLLEKDQQKKTKNEKDQDLKVINLGLPKKDNIEKEDKINESQNKNEDINKNEENKEKNEKSKTKEKEGEVKEIGEKKEKSEKEEVSLNIIPNPQEKLDKNSEQESNGNNDKNNNKQNEEEKMEIQEDLNRVQSQKFKIETYEPVEQGSKIIYGNDDNNGSIEESNKKDDKNNKDDNNNDEYANTDSKKNEPKDSRRPVIQKGDENNNNIDINKMGSKIKQKKILRQKGPKDSERNSHELKNKAHIHNEDMNNKKEEMLEIEGAVPKDSTRKDLQPQRFNKNKKVSQHEQKIQLRQKKGVLNKNIDISNNLEVNPISGAISKFVSTQKDKSQQHIDFNISQFNHKVNLLRNQMNPSEQDHFIYRPQQKYFGLNQYQKYYSKKLNNTNNEVKNKSFQQYNNYRNNYEVNRNENYKGGESRSFYRE
jgi:hypothetical protein